MRFSTLYKTCAIIEPYPIIIEGFAMTTMTVQRDTTVGVVAAIAALSFLLSLIGVGYDVDLLALSGALAFVGAAIGTVWAIKRA